MDRIIIVSPNQYGYLTDTYKYCQYLRGKCEITYICFDEGLDKIQDNKVKVIYIGKSGNLKRDLIKLNMCIVRQSYMLSPKVIFAVYNPLIFLSRLVILNTRLILDIRTGSVDSNPVKRKKANSKIKFNTIFFREISIISESLAEKLKIRNYKLLPLGADLNNQLTEVKNYQIRLIYVGVLSNRNIIKTVKAFNKFYDEYSKEIHCEYTIIGYFSDGNSKEASEFNNLIWQSENVFYLGRKKHSEAVEYLQRSTIGISYVPITDYYDVQPPTKTFEYLSNGLITIGTKTSENTKIISKANGVLCNDDESSVYEALVSVYKNISAYNPDEIKKSIGEYSWKNIVENKFMPIIDNE